MRVTVTDKIQSSHYWLSGEPFTIQDMRLALGVSASTVQGGLRQLDDLVSKHTDWANNGSKTVYRRKTLASEWLKRKWVSGEFHVRGEVPLEWCRGA
jgi:hypothetical protein